MSSKLPPHVTPLDEMDAAWREASAGARLEANLRHVGIDDRGLLRWPEATTSTKTRVLAQGYTGGLHGRQQVMRLDRTTELSAAAARACTENVAHLAPGFDAVLLSDYRGGVVNEASIEAARASAERKKA